MKRSSGPACCTTRSLAKRTSQMVARLAWTDAAAAGTAASGVRISCCCCCCCSYKSATAAVTSAAAVAATAAETAAAMWCSASRAVTVGVNCRQSSTLERSPLLSSMPSSHVCVCLVLCVHGYRPGVSSASITRSVHKRDVSGMQRFPMGLAFAQLAALQPFGMRTQCINSLLIIAATFH